MLRQRLVEVLRTDAELDAFCSDYFPEVHQQFSLGMDRLHKFNLLISKISQEEIWACLQPRLSAEAARRRRRLRTLSAGPWLSLGAALRLGIWLWPLSFLGLVSVGICAALGRLRPTSALLLGGGIVLLGAAVYIGHQISRRGRYLRHVALEHEVLDLSGLRVIGSQPMKLSQVFVELRIAPSANPDRPRGGLLSAVTLDGKSPIWDFLRCLDRKRPDGMALAIVGPPGCGKTTLLRHVAVTLALRQHSRHGMRARIPILLFLRQVAADVAEADVPSLGELLARQAHEGSLSHLRLPPSWFEGELQHGRCLVLLDGLDEVADTALRQNLARWVDRQIVQYPESLFILTSRPHGYREARLTRAEVLETQPFTFDQVRQFVHNWYLSHEQAHVEPHERAAAQQRAQHKAQDLLARIATRPALNELTHNPLLLTMITMVHRYRGVLPQRRIELYDEILEVMLGRWRVERGIPELLPAADKREILSQLAHDMMQRRVRELAAAEVTELLARLLQERGHANLPATRFLQNIQAESGLLIEGEAGRLCFAHLTLQEYLAAAEWSRRQEFPLPLAEMVAEPWWHESLRLWAARHDATALVKLCMTLETISALTLASDCLDEAQSLDETIRREAEQFLKAALDSPVAERRRLSAEVMLLRRVRTLLELDEERVLDSGYLTQAEYQLFIDEMRSKGSFVQPVHWSASHFVLGQGMQPVTGVALPDAAEFLKWLMSRVGRGLYVFPKSEEVKAQPIAAQEWLGCWCQGDQLEGISAAEQSSLETLASSCSEVALPTKLESIHSWDFKSTARIDIDVGPAVWARTEMTVQLPQLLKAAQHRDLALLPDSSAHKDLALSITQVIDQELGGAAAHAAQIEQVISRLPVGDTPEETLRRLLQQEASAPTPAQEPARSFRNKEFFQRLDETVRAPLDEVRGSPEIALKREIPIKYRECLYHLDHALSVTQKLLRQEYNRDSGSREETDRAAGPPRQPLLELASVIGQARGCAQHLIKLASLGAALRNGDTVQARQTATELSSDPTAMVNQRALLLMHLLDVLLAEDAVGRRIAARMALIELTRCCLLVANAKDAVRKRRSKDSSEQDILRTVHWWCQLALQRERGKLPAWEGIRLLCVRGSMVN